MRSPLVSPLVVIARSNIPITQPFCRSPLVLKDAVATEISQLLKEDIIEAMNSFPWVSNFVVVTKKEGGTTFVCGLVPSEQGSYSRLLSSTSHG